MEPIKIVEYRGLEIPVFLDDYSQQFYCIIDDKEFGFGSYNTDFESDLKYLIDQRLDTIHYFDNGAKLMWFDNGGVRDIKLTYRNRILKIFLTTPKFILTDQEKEKIITISNSVLDRICNLGNFKK